MQKKKKKPTRLKTNWNSKNISILCAKLGHRDEWFLTSFRIHRSLFALKNKGGKRKKIKMFHTNQYCR